MISVFGALVGEEEIEAVASCFRSRWMGMGRQVAAFEARFAARLGLPGFVMMDSGSDALYMAVKLLELEPGAEVILPSFTWVSCAHAVVLCGGVPVFCDVDLRTHNLTAETIRPHLSERTGAIMVVHYAGKPVDLEPILRLGVPVIEDAAHAVDSRLHGRACGSLGDIGVYSFDAVKNLATPEAGGLTSRHPRLVERARQLRYCGIEASGFAASAERSRWWEHRVLEAVPKLTPNDVSAAVGLAQLEKLDRLQSRRREIWHAYQEAFASLDWLVRPAEAEPGEQHSYFTYCIRLLQPDHRNRMAQRLYERGIYTTLRYYPLHMSDCYRSGSRLPATELLSEQALNLPLHPALTPSELEQIVSAVRSCPPFAAAQ